MENPKNKLNEEENNFPEEENSLPNEPKSSKVEAKIDAGYFAIKRFVKFLIKYLIYLFSTMRKNFKESRSNPAFRMLVILVIIRAIAAFVLGLICLGYGIYDYNYNRFIRGIFMMYFIYASILGIILLFDIISLIRLFVKRRGRIITIFSTILILGFLMFILLPAYTRRTVEITALFLILYIFLYNLAILLLTFSVKFDFQEISATLAEPVLNETEYSTQFAEPVLENQKENKSESVKE